MLLCRDHAGLLRSSRPLIYSGLNLQVSGRRGHFYFTVGSAWVEKLVPAPREREVPVQQEFV